MRATLSLAVLVLAILGTGPFAQQRPARTPDIFFAGTRQTIVDGMLRLARVTADDVVYDLGSGDGRIVVVDTDQSMLDAASALGLVTVHGSGTRSDVLRVAGVPRARAVVVAANRDDSAVLVTLTARELAPKAQIVAAVREAEEKLKDVNRAYSLLRQRLGTSPATPAQAAAGASP